MQTVVTYDELRRNDQWPNEYERTTKKYSLRQLYNSYHKYTRLFHYEILLNEQFKNRNKNYVESDNICVSEREMIATSLALIARPSGST